MDVYWAKTAPTKTVFMQEDTAGNKWYAEFEGSSTAPVRTWQEPANIKIVKPEILR